MTDLERQLALSIFAEGFKAGADPGRARKSRVLRPSGEHQHFLAGFRAGRDAHDQALDAYKARLKENATHA
jgi:hypothetical protein